MKGEGIQEAHVEGIYMELLFLLDSSAALRPAQSEHNSERCYTEQPGKGTAQLLKFHGTKPQVENVMKQNTVPSAFYTVFIATLICINCRLVRLFRKSKVMLESRPTARNQRASAAPATPEG